MEVIILLASIQSRGKIYEPRCSHPWNRGPRGEFREGEV